MMAPDKELTDEMKRFIHDLNEMYVSQPALSLMDNDYEGFEWIQLMKYEENVLTFLDVYKRQTGYLERYAAMVTSGNRGAILEVPKAK